MSEQLDERVVKLEFDNSKFEKNIKQTQKSLKEFDKQLQFKDGQSGIEKIEASFSHFQMVAFAVINRITNKIIDLGVALVKSLSVDNISAGWAKFGQKTTSVATMAAQKIKIAGKAIEDSAEKMEVINEQLEKLNWFTDETSYNFTDMVDNIGKFTAAGRSLDESVDAMMGIANWAAKSGQNASVASRAMYQLAQALGKGYVQLIDWKSIQTANMDTEEFRETALETAVALGELTKEGNKFITKTGKRFTLSEFTESLSSKWLTNDVLLKTLGKYSSAIKDIYNIAEREGLTATEVMQKYGDQLDEFGLKAFRAAQEARTFSDVIMSVKDAVSTGWMNTAEKIFGGYDEAKDTWTELANQLYDVFAEGGNFRNEVLGLWRDLGGHKNIFGEHGTPNQGAFWNIYDSIIAVRNLISEAWNDVFSSNSFRDASEKAQSIAETFNKLTGQVREFTKRTLDGLRNNVKLKAILTGIFNLVKMGTVIIDGLKYALYPIYATFRDLVSYVIDKLAAVGLNTVKLQKYIEKIEQVSQKVSSTLERIFEYIDPRAVLEQILSALSMIREEINEYDILGTISELVGDFSESLTANSSVLEDFKDVVDGVLALIQMLAKALVSVSKILRAYIIPILNVILKVAAKIVGAVTGTVTKLLGIIGKFFSELNAYLNTGEFNVGSIATSFNNLITNIGNGLKKLMPVLKTLTNIIATLVDIVLLIPSLLNKISKSLTGRDIVENIAWLADKILGIFTSIRDSIENAEFDDASNGSIFTPIVGLVRSTINFFKAFVDAIKPLIELVSKAIDLVTVAVKSIGEFFQGIVNWINGMDAKTAIDVLTRAAIIFAATAIAVILIWDAIYAVIYAIKGFNYFLSMLGESIYGFAKSFVLKALAQLVHEIALSLVALAAAFATLALIPTDGFIRAAVAIGVFTTIITALLVALSIFSDTVSSNKRKFDWTKKGISFSGTMKMSTQLYSLSTVLMSLSAALLAFSVSISIIARLKPSEALTGAGILLAFMTAITVMIAVLMKVGSGGKTSKLDKLNEQTKSLKKAVKLIGVMAAVCFAISKAISKLGGMKDDQLWKGVGALSVILGVLASCVAIIQQSQKTDKKGKVQSELGQVAAMLAALSLFMISVSISINALKDVPVDKAFIVVGEIASLLAAFTIMLSMLSLFDRSRKAAGFNYKDAASYIASMGIVLLEMAGAIAILSNISPGQAFIAIGEIATLLYAFSTMFTMLSFLNKGSFDYSRSSLFLFTMGTTLLELAGVIAILNTINGENPSATWNSILNIVAILGAFTAMVIALNLTSRATSNLKDIKSFLFGMAVVLLAMTAPLAILNNMYKDTPDAAKSAVYSVIGILLALTAMMSTINLLTPKVGNAKSSIGLIIAMSAMLVLMATSLLIMKDIPVVTLAASVIGLVALMAAFTVMIKQLMSIRFNSKKLLQTLSMFAAIAGSMLIMSASLLMLAAVPWYTILAAMGSISAVILSFTAASAILQSAKVSPQTMLSLAASMIILSSALVIFAAGMMLMEDVTWPSIAKGAAILAGSLVLLSAVAVLLKPSITTLLALSGAVLILGVGMLTGATAMMLFASHMGEMAEGVIENADIIKQALDTIGPILIDSLINGFNSLLDNITTIMPHIVNMVSELISSIVEILNVAANSGLPGAIIEIIVSCAQALADHSDELINSLAIVLDDLLGWLSRNARDIAASIADIISDVIVGLAGKIPQLVLSIRVFLEQLINSVFDHLEPLINLLLDRVFEFIVNFIPRLTQVLISVAGVLVQSVLVLIATVIRMVISSLGTLSNLFLDLVAGIILIVVHTFVGLTNVIYQGLRTILANIFNVLFQILYNMPSDLWAMLSGALGALFAGIIRLVGNLMNQYLGGLFGLGDQLIGSADELMSSVNSSLNNGGVLAGDNVTRALNEAKGNIRGVISEITSSVESDVVYGVEQINNAMEDSMELLSRTGRTAGENAGEATADGYRDSLDIHSPSRVFAKLGEYVVEGLANGMEDETYYMRRNLVDEMNDTINLIKMAIEDSDIDDTVTIRPVVDLSGVKSGANSISSIMSNVSGGSLSVSGRLANNIKVKDKGSVNADPSKNQNGNTIINNETYNPTFNITANNPEAVAKEVDIRLQRMRMQSDLAKGGAK